MKCEQWKRAAGVIAARSTNCACACGAAAASADSSPRIVKLLAVPVGANRSHVERGGAVVARVRIVRACHRVSASASLQLLITATRSSDARLLRIMITITIVPTKRGRGHGRDRFARVVAQPPLPQELLLLLRLLSRMIRRERAVKVVVDDVVDVLVYVVH